MFYKYRKMSIVNDIINDYKLRGKDSFEASVKRFSLLLVLIVFCL